MRFLLLQNKTYFQYGKYDIDDLYESFHQSSCDDDYRCQMMIIVVRFSHLPVAVAIRDCHLSGV